MSMLVNGLKKGRALIAGICISTGATAYADTFTFGGYSFDQDNTPNVLDLLGNGTTHGGVTFSANLPNRITNSVGFVASAVGGGGVFTPANGSPDGDPFDPALSLGRQANAQHGLTQSDGSSSHFSSAINLPRGDSGGTTRHGLAVSWNNGKAVVNGAGEDFVVFESGSSSSPEGMMFRARLATTGVFTDWYYFVADSFATYVGSSDGAFATGIDLSDMGIGAGTAVDLIQIANLMPNDRIAGGGGGVGQGQLVFDLSSDKRPDNGSGAAYATGSLDPDPLYVGILNGGVAVVPLPAAAWMGISLFGVVGANGYLKRRRAARV